MSFWHYSLALFWTLLVGCTLYSKEIIIVPCDALSFDLNHYTYSPDMPKENRSNWQWVHKKLYKRGHTIRLSNLTEFDSAEKTAALLKNVKKVIFNNIPSWTGSEWEKKLSWIGKKKCILIGWEPPSVLPEMYSKNILLLFSKVLTWDDSYVDNHTFIKMHYPVHAGMIANHPLFFEKKLVTQISGNKHSPHPHELYSERVKAIQYFEMHPELGFEFYGIGWANEGYRTYCGAPSDKIGVLKNYRFSLCYENITNIKGYITEKIFDCFTAGCVPIYWGATNIDKFIPKNCYILREKFSSMENLVKYLTNMSEKEYSEYIANIQKFLKSRKAKAFTKKAFAKTVVKQVLK